MGDSEAAIMIRRITPFYYAGSPSLRSTSTLAGKFYCFFFLSDGPRQSTPPRGSSIRPYVISFEMMPAMRGNFKSRPSLMSMIDCRLRVVALIFVRLRLISQA